MSSPVTLLYCQSICCFCCIRLQVGPHTVTWHRAGKTSLPHSNLPRCLLLFVHTLLTNLWVHTRNQEHTRSLIASCTQVRCRCRESQTQREKRGVREREEGRMCSMTPVQMRGPWGGYLSVPDLSYLSLCKTAGRGVGGQRETTGRRKPRKEEGCSQEPEQQKEVLITSEDTDTQTCSSCMRWRTHTNHFI